jgi:hypothetical protein
MNKLIYHNKVEVDVGNSFDLKYDETDSQYKHVTYEQDDHTTRPVYHSLSGTAYHVAVEYQDITPFVISEQEFRNNPNYHRDTMTGSVEEWTVGIKTADYNKTYDEGFFHLYAKETTSKRSEPHQEYIGALRITFTRFDGSNIQKDIPVIVEVRECEAYNSGKWREINGRWEQN